MRQYGTKWVLAAATLAVLVSGGVVLGSNMGFKFNMPIVPQTGAPPNGFNIMSIPYLNPYTDRQCFCEQLGLTPSSAVVQQFDPVTGILDLYLCGSNTCGGAATAKLTKARAVFITDSGNSGSGIVVGSHDPSHALQLVCAGGPPPFGDNWVSIAYHTTSVKMQDFCDEIGPDAVTISEFDPNGLGTLNFFNCGGNPLFDFDHTKGRSLKINLDPAGAACTGPGFVNWVPNHF